MKSFIRLYIRLTEAWSKPIIIILLFLLILLFNSVIFPYFPEICSGGKAEPSVSEMLDTRLYYSAEDIQNFLSAKTKSERKCSILVHSTVDVLYPLIYSVFLSILFSLLTKRLTEDPTKGEGKYYKESSRKILGKVLTFLIILPLFILTADYLENTLIIILLAGAESSPNTLARPIAYITPFVTTAKWSFVMLNLTVLLALTLIRIFKRIKSRQYR